MADRVEDQLGWPVWDFVRRKFERNRLGESAEVVLASLPSIPRPDIPTEGPYGLWWRGEHSTAAITPRDRIGLTIPGLHHLTPLLDRVTELPEPATALLRIIKDAADAEAALDADDWWELSRGELDLRGLLGSREPAPTALLGRVLQHEFVPLATQTGQFVYTLVLGEGTFAPFAGVADVADYLFRLPTANDASVLELPRSPLTLPAVLDYLERILAGHPAWGAQHRLVRLPDFSTAAVIVEPPSAAAEYGQRLSSLWTIFGRMQVPEADPAEYANRGWREDGSLNRFDVWLAINIPEFAGSDQGKAALRTIRDLGKLRQAAQHSNADTQRVARTAQRRFGLPAVIVDHGVAWATVLEKVANAVYTICVALTYEEHK